MFWICLLTVGAMPRVAHAQDDFHRYLHTAVQLFQDGENERALEQLQRAKLQSQGVEQDVTVALHEGIFLADLPRKWEESRTAFKTALLLNPDATLPFKVAPKVEKSFKEVRDNVRRQSASVRSSKRPAPAKEAAATVPPVAAAPPRSSGSMTPSPPSSATPQTQPPAVSRTDRPERTPSPGLDAPVETTLEIVQLAQEPRARVPVVSAALAGTGVVAAGVGTWFGLQSRANTAKVRDTYGAGLPPQSELGRVDALLQDARGQARTANVLFGVAGLAVSGAIVTWVLASEDVGTDFKEAR